MGLFSGLSRPLNMGLFSLCSTWVYFLSARDAELGRAAGGFGNINKIFEDCNQPSFINP